MFRILFILILVSFLISWIVRASIMLLARNFFQRVNEQHARQQERARPPRHEGDIHIDKKTNGEKKVDKDIGEYVDYEDIK